MKKLGIVSVVFAFICTTSPADAITVDPAAARLCKQSGDTYDPNTSPHCICTKGAGDQERVNLSAPGTAALARKVAKYGDFRDRCASVSEITRGAPKPDKPKAEVPKPTPAPTPVVVVSPPSCSMSSASVDAPAGSEASNILICSGAVSRITKVVTTCGNCKAPGEEQVKTGKVENYTREIRVSAEPGIKGSQVSVTVLGSKGLNIPLTFKVEWKSSPCVKSGGTDANGKCIMCPDGKKSGTNSDGLPVCVPKTQAEIDCENAPSGGKFENGVCVCPKGKVLEGLVCVEPKKAEPVKTEVVKGEKGDPGASAPSRIHLLLVFECLRAKSDSFQTSECLVGAGLTADITENLKWFGDVSLGAPGATRTDANRQAVLLANGEPDKRNFSAMVKSGLDLHLYGGFGIRAGAFRRMDGLTNGLQQPVHITTGGLAGLTFRRAIQRHTIGIGVDGMCGSHQKGSMASDGECAIGGYLFGEFYTGKK